MKLRLGCFGKGGVWHMEETNRTELDIIVQCYLSTYESRYNSQPSSPSVWVILYRGPLLLDSLSTHTSHRLPKVTWYLTEQGSNSFRVEQPCLSTTPNNTNTSPKHFNKKHSIDYYKNREMSNTYATKLWRPSFLYMSHDYPYFLPYILHYILM